MTCPLPPRSDHHPITALIHQLWFFGKVSVARKKEKYQEAIEIYNWGIKKYPTNFTLTKQKAKLYLHMGDKEEAKATFQLSLQKLEGVKDKFEAEDYEDQKAYLHRKLEECMQN